jgi:uncharacterized protein with von Willebrand factor type A (vWA) domain
MKSDDSARSLGGVIHTYQGYDPANIPSPTLPPPDLVTPAFEHMLEFGNMRELTDEELARAIHLDIRQIAGLGPSLESLRRMLLERKAKILATWETRKVVDEAAQSYTKLASNVHPPESLKSDFQKAVREEQIRDLEKLWYRSGNDNSRFARQLVQLVDRLGDKYQIDELASKYQFTGQKPMTIDSALEVKTELETIERLLKQLEEAQKTAQIAVIDLSELSQFAEAEQLEGLAEMQRQVEELVRQLAEQQGLEKTQKGYQLNPKAYKIFQGRLLEQIFSQLQESRTGRHQGPVNGEGAVELPVTKDYEFGDSVSQMDIPQSLINAMIREPSRPVRMKQDDIVIHKTKNNPKCATSVLMDMSGSMRQAGQYINVKRMGLALDGLIRKEYPGDFLQFIEMASFAKPKQSNELASLMPKPVTIFDPVVRLRADMSREDVSESDVPPHFTNIQHALQLGRQFLSTRDTPNRQIVLITDGLPTAHFDGPHLYLLYPSDPKTEEATMREARLCQREGIVINIFLLPSWSQSHEDIQFAHRLAETTKGRVFFTAGRDLDRFVVWDYVNRRKSIVG